MSQPQPPTAPANPVAAWVPLALSLALIAALVVAGAFHGLDWSTVFNRIIDVMIANGVLVVAKWQGAATATSLIQSHLQRHHAPPTLRAHSGQEDPPQPPN